MKITSNAPRIGKPESYIGLPFKDQEGNEVGVVINCVDNGEFYILTIDSENIFDDEGKIVTFSMS